MKSSLLLVRRGLCALSIVSATHLAYAQAPAEPPAPVDDAKMTDAKAHFDAGLERFNAQAYDTALVEFRKSLELYPTRAAQKNIGVTLKQLKRYDEAADAFDKLIADYPDLSSSDRSFVDKERKDMVALIGTVEIRLPEADATVLVDGIERGRTPLKPFRVSAGQRFVRVIKEGYLPFEKQVDVAGRTNVVVDAKLGALTRGGRLKVSEELSTGQVPSDVLVDNVVVGKAPWEGTLPVGAHVVTLRGEGDLGSPPASVEVRLNQLSKISLVAEPLACELRIEPTPITAVVAVDGVEVGQGVWDGKLRCGGHQVEIGAEGFLPSKRTVSLVEGKPGKVTETLERDPYSSEFRAKNPPRITLDLRVGPALSPNIAGRHGGTPGVESGVAAGVLGQVRVGYQLGMGLGFALDAGFLYLTQNNRNRPGSVDTVGLGANQGLVNDTQYMRGPLVGGSVSVQRGEKLVFLGRVGAGVYIGAWKETRAGTYLSTGNGQPFQYQVPPTPGSVASESSITVAPYVNPEVRLGYRLNKTWIVDAGLQGFLLFGMQAARWTDNQTPYVPAGCQREAGFACPGQVRFRQESLLASTIVAFVPFVGVRAEF